jgi:hypothetical protein
VRPERTRRSRRLRSAKGRHDEGRRCGPRRLIGLIAQRVDNRVFVRVTTVRTASPARRKAKPMPLTTPIAASPQSNVFTERTTMVEVPGDTAPGPRAPALSSGRVAGSVAPADATAPGPRAPARSSGRVARCAASVAASAPGPRAPARSSGRATLDRSLNQGSAPAIGAPTVSAATTTASATRTTGRFEMLMMLLPS